MANPALPISLNSFNTFGLIRNNICRVLAGRPVTTGSSFLTDKEAPLCIMHIYILGLAKGWTDSEAAGETEEREKKTKNSTS